MDSSSKTYCGHSQRTQVLQNTGKLEEKKSGYLGFLSHFSIFLFCFIFAIFRVAALIWYITSNLCSTLGNNTTEPFVSNLIYNIFLDILCTQFYFYDIRLSHWRLSHCFRSPAGEVTVALWSVLLVSELVHSGLITIWFRRRPSRKLFVQNEKKKKKRKKERQWSTGAAA